MTENRINPLLDVMSEIDDNLIANKASTAKKRKKRSVIIAAAAAAVLAVSIPMTVGALTRAPIEALINDEYVEVGYDVYTDERGHKIETFVYDIPEYALQEEREGLTPVGKVRAVVEFSDSVAFSQQSFYVTSYKLVDEAGNVFFAGINNKEVEIRIDENENAHYIFGCPNLADGYTKFMKVVKHMHGDIEVDRCLYVVKEEEMDEIHLAHGIPLEWRDLYKSPFED